MRILHCTFHPKNRSSVRDHRHEHIEWHYIIAGSGGCAVDGAQWEVGAGDLFAIPFATPHGIRIRRSGEWLWQYVLAADMRDDEELLAAWFARVGAGGTLNVGTRRQQLFARLARECDADDRWWRAAAAHRFTALLCELVGAPEAAASEEEGHPAIGICLRMMRERIRSQLGLDELAARCGLDRHYLSRLFTSQVGMPPLRYFTDLKMRLAAAALRDGEETVQSVARQVGFADPYHFSRRFRAWAGVAPSVFRARAAGS